MDTKDKVKSYRKEKNLTQKQLGKLSGLSEITIRKLEAGGSNPKIETLQKIAAALGVKLANIVGEGSELWWEMDFETFKKESPDFEKWNNDLDKGRYGSKDQQRQNLFSDLTFALEHAPRDNDNQEEEYIERLAHIIRVYGEMSQHMHVMALTSSKEKPEEYIRLLQNYEKLQDLIKEHKEDIIKGAFDWLEDDSKLRALIYGDGPK